MILGKAGKCFQAVALRLTSHAQLAGAFAAARVLLLAHGGPVANLGATLVDTQRITYGWFWLQQRSPATVAVAVQSRAAAE